MQTRRCATAAASQIRTEDSEAEQAAEEDAQQQGCQAGQRIQAAAAIKLQNHPSAKRDNELVDDAVAELEACGAAIELEACGAAIKLKDLKFGCDLTQEQQQQYVDSLVVQPLGVASGGGHKKRLILDARYVSCWTRHEPFKYESLPQHLQLLDPDDFMWAWDQKSGYFAVPLPAWAWRLFAFEWKGELRVYTVLPFGWSAACKMFSAELWLPLRLKAGARKTFYLDDSAGAAATVAEARLQIVTEALLMSALGLFPSLQKCQLEPSQRLKFLGFIVDSARMRVFIPEDKLLQIKALLEDARQKRRLDYKTYAL